MREIKRNMAREQMRRAGIPHIHKKRSSTKEGEKPTSYFARNWRKWIFGNPAKKVDIKNILRRGTNESK